MAKPICSEDACEKPVLSRGLCVTHYHRWNRATKDQRPSVGTCEGCGATLRALKKFCGPDCRPRCSVEGCGKPAHSKGLCGTHGRRASRHGDPLTPRVRLPNEGACDVEGCDQPMRKSRLCASHYAMQRRHGEIHEWQYRWGDGGYNPAHRTVQRLRGKAAEHACVDCGRQAQEWSYNGADPDEITDERGRKFTRNPKAYSPRCVPCHRVFDDHPWR